jgi:prolipoprotein diacylglyceryl transferase
MPAAFLPSPASSVWHLGPVPLRAFSLCMVAGVLAGLWLTDWRYRRAGGHEGVILAVATVAVPVGIVGARIYSVVSNAHLYFGHGRDWVDILRFWNGGLGVAGAVAAGALAAWAYCRYAGIDLGPLALAAAPALPVGQAIAVWGNWFNQSLYGRPSSLPWAVAIAPVHRAVGYQTFATFQPIFVYESVLYLLVAAAVAYGIHRFRLTGDLAFALYAGLYATARFCVEAQRVDFSPRLFGIRTDEAAMVAILIVAWPYMLFMRGRRYRRPPILFAAATSGRSVIGRLVIGRSARALRPHPDTSFADERANLARFLGSVNPARSAESGRSAKPEPGSDGAVAMPAEPSGTAGAGDAAGPDPAIAPAEISEPAEPADADEPTGPVMPEGYGSRWQAPERPGLAGKLPAQSASEDPLPAKPAADGPVPLGPASDAQLLW